MCVKTHTQPSNYEVKVQINMEVVNNSELNKQMKVLYNKSTGI